MSMNETLFRGMYQIHDMKQLTSYSCVANSPVMGRKYCSLAMALFSSLESKENRSRPTLLKTITNKLNYGVSSVTVAKIPSLSNSARFAFKQSLRVTGTLRLDVELVRV